MKLLVIGGTRFVGRHIVEAARSAGHQVSVFHRGRSGRGLWADVEDILGDRVEDLATTLVGRRWDAVIDTSAYTPRVVRTALRVTRDKTSFYAFVSTISVYASFETAHQDESAPLARLDDPTTEDVTGESYGALKALCEAEVLRERPDALVVRPGIVVGPHDHTDRFTYWVDRIARGGKVACPGPRDRPVQFIDGRDLGAWIVSVLERRTSGIFNAVGPSKATTIEEWFAAIRDVAGSDAEFVWIDEERVTRAGLEEKMPMWVQPCEREWRYLFDIDSSKARACGLESRPVEETIRDTLKWFRAEREGAMVAGPSREEEAILLDQVAEARR